MTKKRVLLEFVFEELEDEDELVLEPRSVRIYMSELSPDQLSGLGEEIAQTDRWQVDNWNAIQAVLGGDSKKETLR
jgi:hypothetical protein